MPGLFRLSRRNFPRQDDADSGMPAENEISAGRDQHDERRQPWGDLALKRAEFENETSYPVSGVDPMARVHSRTSRESSGRFLLCKVHLRQFHCFRHADAPPSFALAARATPFARYGVSEKRETGDAGTHCAGDHPAATKGSRHSRMGRHAFRSGQCQHRGPSQRLPRFTKLRKRFAGQKGPASFPNRSAPVQSRPRPVHGSTGRSHGAPHP